VLANESDALSVIMAILSDEAFFRWLPDDQEEITREFGCDGHTVLTPMPN